MICIFLFIVNNTIAKNLIIFEYSNTYLVCAVSVFSSLLICLKILNKNKKIFSIISATFCLVITFLFCFASIGVSHNLHRNPRYYNVTINNLPNDYEIVLYEYGNLSTKSGCLCIKINDFIYKRIPGTHYMVESGNPLSDENNLILEYNAETKELIMKYKYKPESEYIEQIAIID